MVTLTVLLLLKTAYGPKHAKKGVHLWCPDLCFTITVSEVPGRRASVSRELTKTSADLAQL